MILIYIMVVAIMIHNPIKCARRAIKLLIIKAFNDLDPW